MYAIRHLQPLALSAAIMLFTVAGRFAELYQITAVWILGLLLVFAASAYFLVKSVISLFRRRWGEALPYLLSIAALALFVAALPDIGSAGDRLYLKLHKAYFLREVAEQGTRDPVLWVYPPDLGGGWSQPLQLAYDDSGEIMLPMAERSDSWKKAAAGTMLACKVSPAPLEDHFYMILFIDC